MIDRGEPGGRRRTAEVEHASAKDLIAQIQDAPDVDAKFDAKVIVLGEYIDHHVKEERNEIFVKALLAIVNLVRRGSVR